MTPTVWISEIEFSDGSKIELSQRDIVVLVGPNNGGKTSSLKESAALLRQKINKGVVVKDITIQRSGNDADLNSFIESCSKKHITTNPHPSFRGYGFDIYGGHISSRWSNYTQGLMELFSVFVNSLSTEDRLAAANPAKNVKLTVDPHSHPIHFLQKNDTLEKQFSDYFRQAFGTDLIVHRNAASEVPLYVGERPIPRQGEDRISEGYLRELEMLDKLHLQGDGMRSFVGVLLTAFISRHSVIFIDEPEAFLHPPQARLLGKMLAKDMPSERQLFLATHSEDFLKGLLDADNSNLRIIRIEREGMINKVSVLNASDIGNIWNDSLLRHSNILSGLFHSKVIICESDSDCRFYSAILSAIYENADSISPDILFVHCGGKHRIPTVVRSLAKLDIIIRVIADFDVLMDIKPLKSIYEEMSGSWAAVESDWKKVKDSIDHKRPQLEKEELKEQIMAIFESTTDIIMPRDKVAEIQKALRRSSAWTQAKEVGRSFIPSGEQTQAYERLRDRLREKGLYIVEVGQLESFDKREGNHGPRWVNAVMAKDLKNDPELEPARKFVQEVTG